MEAPFSIGKLVLARFPWAWGVQSQGWEIISSLMDQKVVFGPALDGFGEYLDTMRQWYSEGLIDPNFTSGAMVENWEFSTLENDSTMLMSSLSGFSGHNVFQQGFCTNDKAYLQPILTPELEEGDTPIKWERNIVAKDNIL